MTAGNSREDGRQGGMPNADFRKSFDQLSVLQSLSADISRSQTLEEILSSVVSIIPQVINCRACQIFLFEDDKFKKIGESVFNNDASMESIDSEVLYWSCKRGNVTVHPGLEGNTGKAIAPLKQATGVIGAIIIDLGEYYETYSEITGLALTTIANHTALAISNCQSRIQLEEKAYKLHDMKVYVDNVIASLPHGVITIDPDGKITVFNKKAEDFFEIRSRIVIGNPYMVAFPDFLRDELAGLLQQIQKNKRPNSVELTFATMYNEERSALITASPLSVYSAEKPGMVCICRDLALPKEVERLRELDKLKDNFISMVSHELQTPLVSLLDCSEALMRSSEGISKENSDSLDVIHREGKRLSELVRNIIDLSKIESDKMDFAMGTVNPATLVRKGADSIVECAEKKGQILSVELNDGLPAVTGDFEKLVRVIFNILSNAVKFTGEGGRIAVGAREVLPQADDRRFVEFFVRDNGIGIEKSDIRKIFDKFTKVENQTSHSGGAGLGMPISKQIIQRHNSELKVESEPGKGSCFFFRISAAG